MLGDAGLGWYGNGSSFKMALSDTKKLKTRENITPERLLQYLRHIAEVLEILGIKPMSNHPRLLYGRSKGKPYTGALLGTRISPFLASQYPRWYKGGEWHYTGHTRYRAGAQKIVPEDLALTPISLAYWYVGDGNASLQRAWSVTPNVSISIFGFDSCSAEILKNQLRSFNLDVSLIYTHSRGNTGPQIDILSASVGSFMNMINQYVIEPYRYKVKLQEVVSPCC